ncbi:MAG: tetratricopeptide repeat protein [Bacteroidia bacterium]
MNQKLNDFISWTGLIGTILSIFSVVAPFIKLKETILITILVMLFLFLVYGLLEFKKLKDKKAKISKRFKISVSFSAISFVVLAVLVALNMFTEKEVPCTFKENQIGIALSSFGKADDNFSFLVHEFLKEEDLEDSVYTIKRVDRNYIDVIDGKSIRQEMDSLCMNSGLLVSGKIDVNDGLFYAKVRFHNFSRRQDSLKIDNDVFPIRNPDISNFSIDNQAQVMADFIAALLSYEQGKTEKSLILFEKCIQKNSNPKNDDFLSACHTFSGNLQIDSDPESSLVHYTKAFDLGSRNKPALENAILTLVKTKKYQTAAQLFEKFPELNELAPKSIIFKKDSVKTHEKKLSAEATKPNTIEKSINSDNSISAQSGDIICTYDPSLGKNVAIPFLLVESIESTKKLTYHIFKVDSLANLDTEFIIRENTKYYSSANAYKESPYGIIGSNGVVYSFPVFSNLRDVLNDVLRLKKKDSLK